MKTTDQEFELAMSRLRHNADFQAVRASIAAQREYLISYLCDDATVREANLVAAAIGELRAYNDMLSHFAIETQSQDSVDYGRDSSHAKGTDA